jgi:Ca2+-binding RTX toxin-like protein
LGFATTTKKGSADDDILTASNAGDKIYGLAGDDTITGGKGSDVLDGGDGNDTIDGGGGNDKITCGNDGPQLTDGNTIDQADGGGGRDILHGEDGTQWLHGGNGIDMLFGGDGDDFVFGDNGSDTLKGDDGNDYMNGGAGKNTLSGGDGDDTLESGMGNDTMDGGKGNDLYEIGASGGFKQKLHVSTTDRSGSETYRIFNADTHLLISDRGGGDRLDFNSVNSASRTSKDDLIFTHTANDLVIEVGDHRYHGEVTIVNFFLSKADRIETLLALDPDNTDLSHSYDLSELKNLGQGETSYGSEHWL